MRQMDGEKERVNTRGGLYNLEEIKLEGMKVAETTFEKQKQTAVSFTVAACSGFHNIGELHYIFMVRPR